MAIFDELERLSYFSNPGMVLGLGVRRVILIVLVCWRAFEYFKTVSLHIDSSMFVGLQIGKGKMVPTLKCTLLQVCCEVEGWTTLRLTHNSL